MMNHRVNHHTDESHPLSTFNRTLEIPRPINDTNKSLFDSPWRKPSPYQSGTSNKISKNLHFDLYFVNKSFLSFICLLIIIIYTHNYCYSQILIFLVLTPFNLQTEHNWKPFNLLCQLIII